MLSLYVERERGAGAQKNRGQEKVGERGMGSGIYMRVGSESRNKGGDSGSFRSNVVKDYINQPHYFLKWQQKIRLWRTFLGLMIPLKQRPENLQEC